MIIKIDWQNPDPNVIDKAASILENGGIVVYPTETAYGIGCNAYDINAVNKIYEIKKRPRDNPLPVIVNSMKMIEEIAILNPKAKLLIEKFHPGPLVIALPKKPIIPDIVNKEGIAFRISSLEIVNLIISKMNKPLVSTSANLSGTNTPYTIEMVLSSINENDVDLILDAGELTRNKPSTIVDFQLEPSPQIIREGEISKVEILKILEIPEEEWLKH
ncbi:MAG: threonylcarbamoyl-AMP synthase [Asgard group archaeon]|nr:threonylcarbamoyl-AMP synthase [Asgard group archaeon]